MSRRCGLSRADVLTAVVIVVLLVGVSLPFLNQHRETRGGRTASANNIKQIALACHTYAGAFDNKLPSLTDVGPRAPTGAGLRSLFFNLLPYVECNNIYRLFDEAQPETYYGKGGAAGQTIKLFVDPADKSAPLGAKTSAGVTLPDPPPSPFHQNFTGEYATTSYAANGLVFGGNDATMPGTFVDGTSNTIMFAQRFQVCISGSTTVYNLWGYGMYGPSLPAFAMLTPIDPHGLASTDQVAPAQNPPNGVTKFTTESNTPDAVQVRIGRADASARTSYPYTFQTAPKTCDPAVAQTPFTGGMLVALGDGSVRVIGSKVSQWTFWAACTPGGKEFLGADWDQ